MRARLFGSALACAGVLLGGCTWDGYVNVDVTTLRPTNVASHTATTTQAKSTSKSTPRSGEIAPCSTLPREAHDTIALVDHGGPYPHPDNDDKRFGNYEGILPKEKSGYYREYTVETPGVRHRGARRLVTGGGSDGRVDAWYYTDDHYETFCQISEDEVADAVDAKGGRGTSDKGAGNV